jgi:hypothetical protein
MRTQKLLVTLVACLPVLAIGATDCEPIVDATLAEIKAGSANWDERTEALVRAAAGAACVKAYSGIYADRSSGEDVYRNDVEKSAGLPLVNAATPTTASVQEATATVAEDDSGWWPKLKRNKVSASPNKKPYERKRD